MKKYRYQATQKGTLSNPYRDVALDSVVESDVEINASWLKRLKDGAIPRPAKPLPVMGGLKATAGTDYREAIQEIEGGSYDEQMKALIAREDKEDAAKDGQGGTGDKAVI